MSTGGFERQDVRVGVVLVLLVLMMVAGALVHAPVWYLFDHYRKTYESRDVRRTQIETQEPVPPEPLLEVNPTANWEAYRAQQQKELTTYGWISREEKRARIPIDRAMELMVERK